MGKRPFKAAGSRAALLLTGTAAAALAVAGCGGTSADRPGSRSPEATASYYTGWPTQGTPRRGGTLTVDVTEPPTTFDPPKAGAAGLQALLAVNASLFEFMPTSGDRPPVLKSMLVSSWTVSSDRRTYTIHLRPGLQFSNGQPLTAEDVVFSLFELQRPYLVDTQFKSAKVTGKLTFQVSLKRAETAFLEIFSDTAVFPVIPKSVYKREGGKRFGEHPVGMGPFILQSATSANAVTTYVRNPYYTHEQGGRPYLDKLVLNTVENDNARILGVRSGGAQIAQGIPYAQVPALKAIPGVKVLVGPLWGASYINFNRNKAPYNNLDVRKALEYATPREEIIKTVYKGIGKAPNALGGELKYWNPSSPTFPYDISKAKELLRRSPVPNGFDMTITAVGGETQSELLASVLQSSYAKIGVHASIETEPITTFNTNVYAGKFDLALWPPEIAYSNWYAPDVIYLYMADNKFSQANWTPPASTKVLAEMAAAKESNDEGERERLFRKVQRQTYYEEALMIPGTTLVTINLVNEHVRGFQVIPNLSIRWGEVWLTNA